MALVHVQCPYCQSIDVMKYGKQANGTQRYRCNNSSTTVIETLKKRHQPSSTSMKGCSR